MQPQSPLVSIVIPCYNHEKFVHTAIQSVIDQTYENIELIVIDDGSRDNSIDVIKSMVSTCQARFVRFEFRHRPNKGLSETLNEAVEWCRGEYYSALASDDIILNDKVEFQVGFLEENKNILAVFGGVKLIDESLNELKTSLGKPRLYTFKRLIMHKFDLPAPTQMIRFEAIRKVGAYNPNIIIEDWYMWLKLSSIGNIYYINKNFALYRQHDSNMSKNLKKMQEGRLDVINQFKDSSYYTKALNNVKWLNIRENLEVSDEHKIQNILNLFYIMPVKTANFLFKKLVKKIKLYLRGSKYQS